VNVEEHNAGYFDFLRRRSSFAAAHGGNETIEAYVVWASAVAALMRIHGRRVGHKLHKDRRCFVDGLLDLEPSLSTVSIPLLAHDLRQMAPHLREQEPILSYVDRARISHIWRCDEDVSVAAQTAHLRNGQPVHVQHAFDRNRYAEILYDEYRCCAVHGLELGWKTFPKSEGRSDPGYMNYKYLDDNPRPPQHRYRTRIIFPIRWLTHLLDDVMLPRSTDRGFRWDRRPRAGPCGPALPLGLLRDLPAVFAVASTGAPPGAFPTRTGMAWLSPSRAYRVAVLTALRVLRWQRLLPTTRYTQLSKNSVLRRARGFASLTVGRMLATRAGRTLSGPLPPRPPAAAAGRGLRGCAETGDLRR